MATNSEEFKDTLHCPICLEIFENPQILRCLHTICKECLSLLQKQGPIKCPNCRQISKNSEVKKDFNKQTLLDIYNKTQIFDKQNAQKAKAFDKPDIPNTNVCQICAKAVIKWGCIQCEKLLCENCKVAHPLIPACSRHDLKQVEAIAQPKTAKLQQVAGNLNRFGERLTKEGERLKETKGDFLRKKQDVLNNVQMAEAEARQIIESYFLKVKKEIELNSLKYIVNIDQMLSQLSLATGTFTKYLVEINDIVKQKDYREIIFNTEAACATIERDIKKASALPLKPRPMPKFELKPYTIPIQCVNLILDKPKLKTETLRSKLQPMSFTGEQASSKAKPPLVTQYMTRVATEQQSLPVPTVQPEVSPMTLDKKQPSSSQIHPDKVSLKTFHQQKWQLEKDLTANCLPARYFNLSCVGSEIWCTLSDKIEIYNTDGVYLRQFQNDTVGKPFHALQTVCGNILIAGTGGFYLFNNHEEMQCKLCNDRYVSTCSLSTTEEIVCGLNIWSKQAVAFKNTCRGKWDKVGNMDLPEVDNVQDTIKGNTKHLLVCSHSRGVISQHDIATGKLLKRIDFNTVGEALKMPYICHFDMNGWLLVCDSGNKRLVLLDAEGQLCKFNLGEDVTPGYAVVDNLGKLWIYHGGLKLLKFRASIEPSHTPWEEDLGCVEKAELIKLL